MTDRNNSFRLRLAFMFAAAVAAMPGAVAMAANDLVVTGGAGGQGGNNGCFGDSGGFGTVLLDGFTPSTGAQTHGGAAGGGLDEANGNNGSGGGGGITGGSGGNGTNTGGGGGGGKGGGAGGLGNGESGNGGAGATADFARGGGGGGGGNASYDITGSVSFGSIAVTGGTGGHIFQSWDHAGGGGGGGSASLSNLTGDDIVVTGSIQVHGGRGGDGGVYNTGAKGGDGGGALFNTGNGNVTASGIDIASGTHDSGNSSNAGSGGSANFIALGALSASTITLTKQHGSLSFTAGTLNVDRDTNFAMDKGTVAGMFDVSVNGLSFSNASRLTIATDNGAGFTSFGGNLSVTGGGNRMNNATSNAYNASGKTLAFVMDGSETAGGAMLDTAGTGGITVDNTTGFSLTGTTGLGLYAQVTLANNITGALDASYLVDGYIVGKRTLAVSQAGAGADLLATVTAVQTYRKTQDALLPPSVDNANLQNGANYLDLLEQQLGSGDTVMQNLDAAFSQATASGSPWNQRAALGQLYGEYGSYANSALSSDASRFRNRWQGQNRSFFDASLFSGLLPGTASAGFASESGLASPIYGARDRIACGQSRIWAGGFGAWAKQNERSNLPGYKYDSQGAVLGYEYTIGNLNLGFAAAYSRGDLKVNDLRYKNEADVLNLALYGAYVHESGFYAEGGFGYGHAWNDYKVHSIAVPGGVKKAKYDSDAFTANLELGYIARLPQDFNLIPSVGVEYTYLHNDSWTEKVNNAALVANRFDSSHDNGVDIPVGIRFNKVFRFGCDGGFVVPEFRAAYVYSTDKSHPSITAGYAGTQGGAKMVGVDPGRSHWRVGVGLSGRVNSRVDFRIDYDFETRSGFKGHNLNASVGLSF